MTDEQFIKALECCIKAETRNHCEELHCPFCLDFGCYCVNQSDADKPDEALLKGLCTLALDFIKRQQKEKQKLEIELKAMRGAANSYKAEVERLTDLNKVLETDIFNAEMNLDSLNNI